MTTLLIEILQRIRLESLSIYWMTAIHGRCNTTATIQLFNPPSLPP
jgi:hypothetical protein